MGGSQSAITPEMLQQELLTKQNAAKDPNFLSRTMPKLAKICSLVPAPPVMVLGVSISVIICIKQYRQSNTLDDPKITRALDNFFTTAELLRNVVGEFSKVCDYSETERRNPKVQKVINDLGNNIQTLTDSLSMASESIKPQQEVKGLLGVRKKWEFNADRINAANERLQMCKAVFDTQCQALTTKVHLDNANNIAEMNDKLDGLTIQSKLAEENAMLRDQKEQELKKQLAKVQYQEGLDKAYKKPELILRVKPYGIPTSGNKPVILAAAAEYCIEHPGTYEKLMGKQPMAAPNLGPQVGVRMPPVQPTPTPFPPAQKPVFTPNPTPQVAVPKFAPVSPAQPFPTFAPNPTPQVAVPKFAPVVPQPTPFPPAQKPVFTPNPTPQVVVPKFAPVSPAQTTGYRDIVITNVSDFVLFVAVSDTPFTNPVNNAALCKVPKMFKRIAKGEPNLNLKVTTPTSYLTVYRETSRRTYHVIRKDRPTNAGDLWTCTNEVVNTADNLEYARIC